MTKWEYATFASRGSSVDSDWPHSGVGMLGNHMQYTELLTRLGKEGWELVSVSYDDANIKTIFFLKRPIS